MFSKDQMIMVAKKIVSGDKEVTSAEQQALPFVGPTESDNQHPKQRQVEVGSISAESVKHTEVESEKNEDILVFDKADSFKSKVSPAQLPLQSESIDMVNGTTSSSASLKVSMLSSLISLATSVSSSMSTQDFQMPSTALFIGSDNNMRPKTHLEPHTSSLRSTPPIDNLLDMSMLYPTNSMTMTDTTCTSTRANVSSLTLSTQAVKRPYTYMELAQPMGLPQDVFSPVKEVLEQPSRSPSHLLLQLSGSLSAKNTQSSPTTFSPDIPDTNLMVHQFFQQPQSNLPFSSVSTVNPVAQSPELAAQLSIKNGKLDPRNSLLIRPIPLYPGQTNPRCNSGILSHSQDVSAQNEPQTSATQDVSVTPSTSRMSPVNMLARQLFPTSHVSQSMNPLFIRQSLLHNHFSRRNPVNLTVKQPPQPAQDQSNDKAPRYHPYLLKKNITNSTSLQKQSSPTR